MQWYIYFHEVRDGMFYSTRQSRIKIAYYFQDDLRSKFRHITKFKKKSTWSPPDNQILGAVKEKITQMESEIKSLKILKENLNLKNLN